MNGSVKYIHCQDCSEKIYVERHTPKYDTESDDRHTGRRGWFDKMYDVTGHLSRIPPPPLLFAHPPPSFAQPPTIVVRPSLLPERHPTLRELGKGVEVQSKLPYPPLPAAPPHTPHQTNERNPPILIHTRTPFPSLIHHRKNITPALQPHTSCQRGMTEAPRDAC